LPKSLISQFKRHANIYFLFIGIIQCIPAISPLNPATAIAPFVLVLMISLVREAVEDYYKHVNDERENLEKVFVFKGNSYTEGLSKNLQVGDIIRVEEYGIIPSDIVLLSSSNLNKMAYIETANLDGEKNLKPKFCIGSIFSIFKDANNVVRIRGKIICDKPNSDLNKFNGRIKLTSSLDISVGVKQILYKGIFLK
jgi:P-type E1-E2 ATPase